MIVWEKKNSWKVYLGKDSILVDGATGVTSIVDADDDVEGIGIWWFGDVDMWGIGGGDIEWDDDGDGILWFVLDWTCFNRCATSRLFIIFLEYVLERFGAKCSSIASLLIMSIKFDPFISSFCN